jgi:hypothetical protein
MSVAKIDKCLNTAAGWTDVLVDNIFPDSDYYPRIAHSFSSGRTVYNGGMPLGDR